MQIRQNNVRANLIRQHGLGAVTTIAVGGSSVSAVLNFSSPLTEISTLIDDAIERDNIKDSENNIKFETQRW